METGVLLHMLRDSKVLGKVGVWLGKFLDSGSRKQAVAVEGRLSGLSPVISGVPQGTVLGPILFLLHISCISKEVSEDSTVSSYVDDTRVTRTLNNPGTDCLSLQQDLQAIYKWAKEVNMVFNGDKFEMLRFWPGRTPKPVNVYILTHMATPLRKKAISETWVSKYQVICPFLSILRMWSLPQHRW